MTIDGFEGQYVFLGNGFMCEIFYNHEKHYSVNAAIQYMEDSILRKRMLEGKSYPFEIVHDPGWKSFELQLMERVVRAKFVQNKDLAVKLIETGDAQLINSNTHGDTYWGVDADTGNGENHLGNILMRLRAELTKDDQPQFVIWLRRTGFPNVFIGACSDKATAFDALAKMQAGDPDGSYEVWRESPYRIREAWDPATSSWLPVTWAPEANAWIAHRIQM